VTRRTAIVGTAAALVLLGFFSLAALFWPSFPGKSDSQSYIRWRGDKEPLHVSFDVPEGWRLALDRGRIERFEQVLVKGPRNADDTYSALLVVRATPSASKGGKFAGAREFAADYRRHLYTGHSVVADRASRVAGEPAIDLTVAYVVPPLRVKPARGEPLKPIPVPVQSRTVFFERGGWIYELILSSDRREFAAHAPNFERLAESFRFGDS